MNKESKILRIPKKYSELICTMDNEEAWKLMKALFMCNDEKLEWTTKVYFDLMKLDIDNIEDQVSNWKKGAEYGKLGGRPSKKNPQGVQGGDINQNPKDKDKVKDINKYKINKKEIILSKDNITKKNKLFFDSIEFDKNLNYKIINEKLLLSVLNDLRLYKKPLESYFTEDEIVRETINFIKYWTEPTAAGRKQLWQTKKTFDLNRRLFTWFGNKLKKFNT